MNNSFNIIYRVKVGDTLNSISEKFNTSVNDIVIINKLVYPILSSGQWLKIPVYSKYRSDSNIEYNPLCNRVIKNSNLCVYSPDGNIEVEFILKDGVPYYSVIYLERNIIKTSKLGFTFNDAEPLNHNLMIKKYNFDTFDESWIQPWGEVREVRNNYNELIVELEEFIYPYRKMYIVFRVYDYGVGFRYEFPEQDNLSTFEIMEEETEFVLSGDNEAWWIPALQINRYEYLYINTPITSIVNSFAVQTPLTMKITDGLYMSIHEANLNNYASMTLLPAGENKLIAHLVPWSTGIKVYGVTPFKTPWRTIQIAEKPGDLITSYLILNLNEPNKLGDVSWIKPGKYVGIWWGMHLGKYTWSFSPKHGATTENTKRYIDFAAKYGFPYVLVEGWNIGWNNEWQKHGEQFNFTTPYSDYDIPEVTSYAAKKGVKIIGHLETAGAIQNFERQMEATFTLFKEFGIDTIKTGYVGYDPGIKRRNEQGIILGLEWHHGQYMVNHYRKVIEITAGYHIGVDVTRAY